MVIPLGLLILTHRRRKIRDDLWHWVTIVGYEETKKGLDIIFLDCGDEKGFLRGFFFFLKKSFLMLLRWFVFLSIKIVLNNEIFLMK